MKLRYLFIGGSIIFAIAICFYLFILPFMVHQSIIEESHAYQPQTIISSDGEYVLKTHRIEDSTGIYASFSVILMDTQEEIFTCQARYRTMDLKSISWDDATHDIIIKSGDIGSISYRFVNNTWEKQ